MAVPAVRGFPAENRRYQKTMEDGNFFKRAVMRFFGKIISIILVLFLAYLLSMWGAILFSVGGFSGKKQS